MAIKRQSVSPKTPPVRRRASGSRPADNEPIYSADEKRQLILAHAAMREPQDPLQAMSAWAGVAIAVLVIGVGWWWASGSVILNTAGNVGQDVVSTFKDASKVFEQGKQETVSSDLMQAVQRTNDQLRVMQAQAATREQALNDVASHLATSTSATAKTDLFRPSATATPIMAPVK